MVELAIFGSFLLFGLVLVVRYGVSSYASLKLTQEAFRTALRRAYETRAYGDPRFDEVTIKPRPKCPRCLAVPDPLHPECDGVVDPDCPFSPDNQGSVVLVRDVHIPDPSNVFATGVRTPMFSSASVVWGTDSAEYDPADVENSTDLPKSLYRINDQDFVLKTSRFRVDEVDYGPTVPQLLCDYFNIYGSIFVDFVDAAGNPIEAGVDFKTCGTSGLATIHFKDKAAAPAKVLIEIADSCLGDTMDPDSCRDICQKITAKGLPKPDYCSIAPDFCDATTQRCIPQGLDIGNFTRVQEVNDQHLHHEDGTAIQSHTSINETTTVERTINLNPAVWGNFVLDATTSVERERQQDWSTNW